MFDLGGVLVENVGFESFNELLPSALPMEELKTQWLSSPAVRSFEAGRCTAQVFAKGVVAEWNLPLTPDAFLDAFTYWPKGLYPGAAELLSTVRGRFKLACLSNSNEIHWERFGAFKEHFDLSLSSHVLGEVKPDARCFARALEECSAAATEVAFFDDSLTNIAGARAVGMEAIHVNGLWELRQALAARGWI